MKAQWVVTIIVTALVAVAFAIVAEQAFCYNCLASPCIDNSACLPGCSCLVLGDEGKVGQCVGVY